MNGARAAVLRTCGDPTLAGVARVLAEADRLGLAEATPLAGGGELALAVDPADRVGRGSGPATLGDLRRFVARHAGRDPGTLLVHTDTLAIVAGDGDGDGDGDGAGAGAAR